MARRKAELRRGIQQTPHRWLVGAVMVVGVFGVIASGADSAANVIVDDQFSRSVIGGWNSAPTGGAWYLDLTATAADFDVTGTAGTIVLPAAGAYRSAALRSVTAQDLDLRFRVAIDKLPTLGSLLIYGIVRRTSTTSSYSANLRIDGNGQVFIGASSQIYNERAEIGTEHRVTGLASTPGSFIWLRTQVNGTNPTAIRIRAWADGGIEPTTWLYDDRDDTAALQAPGAIGLGADLSSVTTNAPVQVTIDDLSATGGSNP